MTIGPVPPLAGNSNAPYFQDSLGVAAGFGLVFASALTSTNTGFGAEYQHGTHAAAIYDSQFKGAVFKSVKGNAPNNAVRSVYGAPQQYDFTLQAWFDAPNDAESFSIGSEYSFGLHQTAIANSQIQSQVWSSVRTPPGIAELTPFPLLFAQPQELTRDLTIQGWVSIPSVPQGWLLTMVGAGPQVADLTMQASFQRSAIKNIQASWNPTTIVGVWQQDPTQISAWVKRPSPSVAPAKPITQFFAQPVPWDYTVNQGFIRASTPPPPSKVVQPAIILRPQQSYVDVPQGLITPPIVGQLPILVALTGQAFNFATGLLGAAVQQLTGIYDYFSLAQALIDFSHRSDIANYQDYYISQAETRIYRDVFAQNIGNGVKWLEQPFTATITNQVAAVPINYWALKAMQLVTGNVVNTLLYKDPQWIYANYSNRQPAGVPQYVARDGTNFVFGPTPDSAYQLQGTYYGSSTPLSATSPLSWMTTVCPDLLLASCMLELQPFLKDRAAMQTWGQIYQAKLMALVNLDQAERMAAGSMTMEPE